MPRKSMRPTLNAKVSRDMHRALFVSTSLIAVSLTAFGCGKKEATDEHATEAPPAATMTVLDPAFNTPESVLHDPVADVYLVSNINGDPLAKDGNGFIARVSPDGSVIAAKWIENGVNGVTLDAPKGMALRGDTLFVSDIDVVRAFHRTTGAPIATWPIAGATFLNDMASGPDGSVYVSDTGFKADPAGWAESGTDAVYRIDANGNATAVAMDVALGRPNGLCVDASGILVVTFGSGDVYRLDPATGARTDLPDPPAGQLDGVERLANGDFLVSSWSASAVYRLDGAGTYTVVLDSMTSPADIGYDAGRGRVLIPIFMQNRVEIREVQ
jgi:hypothetical protein